MGFLDYMNDGQNSGGLLDRLMSFYPQQFPAGLASDQAQYGQPAQQMPVYDPREFNPIDATSPYASRPVPQGQGAPMQAMAQAPSLQPQMPQAPAMPAPLRSPEPQSSLMAGFQSWANTPVGNPMAALANGIAGFSSGKRVDPAATAQQNLRDQYQALVPILGEEKALLATINPEFGKAVLTDALEQRKTSYNFVQQPDGTVLRTNAKDGLAVPAYHGNAKPTFGVISEDDGKKVYGWTDPTKRSVTPYDSPNAPEKAETVTGPDGKEIPIPKNGDRKGFVREVSKATADAATNKKTEVQAKSEKFGNQMELAEKNLAGLEGEGTSRLSRATEGSDWLPGSASLGRSFQSDNSQKYVQARNSFVTALLRDESGAAIGTAEFDRREKEMFPQPGDGKAVIEQKRELRRVAIEGMKKAAGPGYKPNAPTETVSPKTADPLGIR